MTLHRHSTGPSRLATLFATMAAVLLSLTMPTRAQIELPCCIDFDDGTVGDWIGVAVNQFNVRQPGPSGLEDDSYLHASDASGASWVRGGAPCPGDWKALLEDGRCVELCWDVQLITDGDPSQVIERPARIYIESGNLSAVFTTATNITESGDDLPRWYSFCAPIAPLNEDGTLPSSEQGQWQMMGDATPESWNELLCNVETVAFFVDYHSSISEEWGWDNICLRESDDCDCMKVDNLKLVGCKQDADGNYIYTYQFDVTNLSGLTADTGVLVSIDDVVTFLDPDSVLIDNQLDLEDNETDTVFVQIAGTPGEKTCFTFVLVNNRKGECCRDEICVKIPCVKIGDEKIDCVNGPGLWTVDYSFTIQNVSGTSIDSLYLVPNDSGVFFNPSRIELNGLADGNSANIGPISILGAAPDAELCFYVVLLDNEGRECCVQEHCIPIPDCGPAVIIGGGGLGGGGGGGNLNGTEAEPCALDNELTVVSPDECFAICEEEILCNPVTGQFTYSFNVTNLSPVTMTHLLIDDSAMTPSSVVFNPPLVPGAAAQVHLTLTGFVGGDTVTVPMVLLSTEQCTCCSFFHEITLPECPCMKIVRKEVQCVSSANGIVTYEISLWIQNLLQDANGVGQPIDHVIIYDDPDTLPDVGPFVPEEYDITINYGGIGQITTQIDIPVGEDSLQFFVGIHTKGWILCCLHSCRLELPDCCDCEEQWNFLVSDIQGIDPELPGGISLSGLEMDPEDGKIGFPPDGSIRPFPYVYMAASARGTIVRIDADTGTILGEYRTVPQSKPFPNPSRTTIDKFGECWVGNRGAHVNIAPPGQTANWKGSVTRIGLVEGGTRGKLVNGAFVADPPNDPNPGQYLQPPFTYKSPSVMDRDGDGLIRTSTGLADILDWDNPLTGSNDAGGVNLALDECITNHVLVDGTGIRALAIDADNDLWVGGTASGCPPPCADNDKFNEVDGATGTIIGAPTNPGDLGRAHIIPGGYGALIDSNNVLWSVNRPSGIYRYDINAANPSATFIAASGVYGIGINPCNGNIWASSFGGTPQNQLRRFDPSGTLISAWTQPGGTQGLCVDQNGVAWGASGQVWRCDQAGNFSTIGGFVGVTGTAVDYQGNIWASDLNGNSARRIDPIANAIDLTTSMGPGSGPYNYSDMTGFVAVGNPPQGTLTAIHDSLCDDTDWGRVTWETTGLDPDLGCRIIVEVRASNDPLNFPLVWKEVQYDENFCNQDITGRYIEVRVTLIRPTVNCEVVCDPKLCWLRVECCKPGDNSPPEIAWPGPVLVHPAGQHETVTLTAIVSDPDNDELETVWTVNGEVVQGGTLNDGVLQLTHDFASGINEVVLSVSDGRDITTCRTQVEIGDHTAPDLTAPASVGVTAFSAVIADLRDEVGVSDNVDGGSVTLEQSPEPGTVVTQGIHEILFTARDEAGNSSIAQTFLTVAPMVAITSFPNYSRFEVGEVIEVDVSALDEENIIRWQILLDGEVFFEADGPPTLQQVNEIPLGEHSVSVRVFNQADIASTSKALAIYIEAPNLPPPLRALAVGEVIGTPTGDFVPLSFHAPAGFQCCLQFSDDLVQWDTLHIIEGQDEDVSINIEILPDRVRGFFRLLLIPLEVP